ncbi:MAG: cytochrome P460 family protein [Armatimonadota bacterium]|nr:cytochrome P460 family protein [Armatimonadota bacterium]
MDATLRISLGVAAFIAIAACTVGHGSNPDDISGYRKWTQVNQEPVYMEPFVAFLCVPTPPEYSKPNPHMTKYFTVYVNDVGKAAMLSKGQPKFPVGSIIVKEKVAPAMSLSDANFDAKKTVPKSFEKPELLTVMIKRDKGFNPKCGDWEFRTAKSDGKYNVGETTNHCVSCHESRPTNDFTYRTYIR